MKITRRMRETAKLCGIDARDDAAVLRWERERAEKLAEALTRLAADEGSAR